MKRFFTKKSVALILATIVLVGFSSFNFKYSNAQSISTSVPPVDTSSSNYDVNTGSSATVSGLSPATIVTVTDKTTGITYTYQGGGQWVNGQTKALISTTDMQSQHADLMTTDVVSAMNKYQEDITTDLSLWVGLKTLFNYGAGVISLFSGTGVIIGFLQLLNMVLNLVVTVAAFLFDQSIVMSIFHTKEWFDANGTVDFIWAMMRDLLNVTFIFILLYISIAKIIGSWGVKAKTTIVNVVLSAIFINFSMFIAKLLIDAGNLVAVQLYNSMVKIAPFGFSEHLFNSLGLAAIINNVLSISGQLNMVITLLLSITLGAVLIWVFLFGAFVLIGRIVMLLLLTMFSPIGFLFGTLPVLGEYSTAWWKSFIDQILVAPAMMLVLLIASKVLASPELSTAIKASQSSLGTNPEIIDVSSFIFYILVIILLVKGMGYVKKLSGEVAGSIVKVAAVAAVAGGAAITGGAALGAGMISSEGALAAANAARVAGKSPWAARLNFSARNLGEGLKEVGKRVNTGATGVKDFATGKLNGTPGVVGLASTLARTNIMAGVKNATGGTVDLAKIEKDMKESAKKAEENLSKAAEAVGPQKALDRQKQLNDTRANITEQAEMRLPEDIRKQKPEKEKDVAKAIKEATNDLTEKTKAVADSKVKLVAAQTNKDIPAMAQAQKELKTAETDLSAADAKVKNYQNFAEKIKIEEEKVAKEMGIAETKLVDNAGKAILDASGKEQFSALETIEKEGKELTEKIKAGIEKRNEYITNLGNRGKLSTLLWAGDRKKLIEKLRAQKGKYNADKENLSKNILKAIKDSGLTLPKDEGEKEETPKAA